MHQPVNMLSVDVEDYFHVSAFEEISPPSRWGHYENRVEKNTEILLEMFAEFHCSATFFVLGWVAQRFPDLIRRINESGHEIASHGSAHRRVNRMSRGEFREDVRTSKRLLEDISGQSVLGYRAPSYSISETTPWAFDELLEAGYTYDSSIFPIRHDFYGVSNWPRFPGYAVKGQEGRWKPATNRDKSASGIFEIPITTLRLAGSNWPIAGGGYFRLFPYGLTRAGLKRINEKEKMPFMFYLHPWEIDHEQPRMRGAGFKSRFRHYINLDKTENRLRLLLADFKFAPVRDVYSESCKAC